MSSQFDQVSVLKEANVFFDGKCVSHTVLFADGSKKTLGIIFPSNLTFTTKVMELMEITSGECRVKIGDETEWTTISAGQEFQVPAGLSFDITTDGILQYVCHFA